MKITQFHNPALLRSPGKGPWRFLVLGEVIPSDAEFVVRGTGQWQVSTLSGGSYSPLATDQTYRTKLPLPAPYVASTKLLGERVAVDKTALRRLKKLHAFIYEAEGLSGSHYHTNQNKA